MERPNDTVRADDLLQSVQQADFQNHHQKMRILTIKNGQTSGHIRTGRFREICLKKWKVARG